MLKLSQALRNVGSGVEDGEAVSPRALPKALFCLTMTCISVFASGNTLDSPQLPQEADLSQLELITGGSTGCDGTVRTCSPFQDDSSTHLMSGSFKEGADTTHLLPSRRLGCCGAQRVKMRNTCSRPAVDVMNILLASLLITASKSATPTVASPEGLSRRRNDVERGSSSSSRWCSARRATAIHSAHSIYPLQFRSNARTKKFNCANVRLEEGPSIWLSPCANSSKLNCPSSLRSRAKNKSYQGTSERPLKKLTSPIDCAQTIRISCCIASKFANLTKSDINVEPYGS
mmetsp:Transcript_91555/g.144692  ORF Transcript_91555/g.144692 Transcript_91555/m.144692 type:complete len:288 (+) Transcript_91555:247-1110(+)